MKKEDLLPAKQLVSVLPLDVRLSVTIQSGSSRGRIVIGKEAFDKLYNPGLHGIIPRCDVHGTAAEGLIIEMTQHGGFKVDVASKNSVYFNFGMRVIGGVENKVSATEIEAVVATYEDGSRYLLTGPLPQPFLSTRNAQERKNNPNFKPLRAAEIAFEAAGIEMPEVSPAAAAKKKGESLSVPQAKIPDSDIVLVRDEATPPVEEKPQLEAQPAPQRDDQSHIAAFTGEASDVLERFRSGATQVQDIAEMLNMLNAEAKRLAESGDAKIAFRVNENNEVKAAVAISASFEL